MRFAPAPAAAAGAGVVFLVIWFDRTCSQLTTNDGLLEIEMRGFFAFVGASVGGWIGWAVGAHIGLMTAYMFSVVGTAVGVFGGRRAASSLLD